MTSVKICGVTSVRDAHVCVEAGADAIGVNLWPGTRRCVDEATARDITEAVGQSLEVVAIFVDASVRAIEGARERTGIRWVQLHGDEPADVVEALLPWAYKALCVTGPEAVERAMRYPGDRLLLDASVPGRAGGTGHTFDWDIARRVGAQRRIILAGGLTPDNVAEAVAQVAPWRVDVASGVERAPGVKDPDRVRTFVRSARGSA